MLETRCFITNQYKETYETNFWSHLSVYFCIYGGNPIAGVFSYGLHTQGWTILTRWTILVCCIMLVYFEM